MKRGGEYPVSEVRVEHLEQAAQLLRRLLDAVERGQLVADGPVGVNLVRRMDGAALALEAVSEIEGRGRIRG